MVSSLVLFRPVLVLVPPWFCLLVLSPGAAMVLGAVSLPILWQSVHVFRYVMS